MTSPLLRLQLIGWSARGIGFMSVLKCESDINGLLEYDYDLLLICIHLTAFYQKIFLISGRNNLKLEISRSQQDLKLHLPGFCEETGQSQI